MAESGIVIDSNPMPRNLGELAKKLDGALYAIFEYQESRVQSYARQNARWTDRTSNARNGLFAKHTFGQAKHRITVYHSVPYGPWLELAHSGKYQIIIPTITTMAPQVMAQVRDLMGRLS